MEDVKNIADIQQNQPKKKFCFAIIPLIVYGLAFVALSLQIYTSSIYSWSQERTWILFFLSLFVHLVSMILLMIFISKHTISPALSIPFFGFAFSNILTFFNSIGEIFVNYEDFIPYFNNEKYDFYIERDGHIENFLQDFELNKHFLINSVLDFILSFTLVVAFLVIAVYVILATVKKNSKAIKILSFIPVVIGVVPGVVWIIHTFEELYYGMNLTYYQFTHFDPMSHIIECLAIAIGVLLPLVIFLIMFCLWVSKPYKNIKVESPKINAQERVVVSPAPTVRPASATSSTPVYIPTPASNSVPINSAPVAPDKNNIDIQEKNADIIRKYKELLDLGAITQEEFDEKKREILNNK